MNQNEPIVINEQEEAEYIQNYLIQNGKGIIAVEDISLIFEGQMKYMEHIGLIDSEQAEGQQPTE